MITIYHIAERRNGIHTSHTSRSYIFILKNKKYNVKFVNVSTKSVQISHDLMLMRFPAFGSREKGYDIISAYVFPFKLLRFHFKKGINLLSTILL